MIAMAGYISIGVASYVGLERHDSYMAGYISIGVASHVGLERHGSYGWLY